MIFSFMFMDLKSSFLIESSTMGKCKSDIFSCYDWEKELKAAPLSVHLCFLPSTVQGGDEM